jgi:sugar lactone lactonase YvrE
MTTKFNLCRLPGIRVLIFALAARLLCGYAIAGDVVAISDGESVNYYAFGGGELGSTNFGVSIYGLATDPTGNIIVAELNGGPVKLSGTTGSGTALATGTSAAYYYGVAFDSSGNLYMTTDADSGPSSDIKVFKYNGETGSPSQITDTATNTSFSVKNTVAVDPVTGDIFVADYYNSIIDEYGPTGGTVPIATLSVDLSHPVDLAIDSNENLYVTNAGNNSLIKFSGETGTPTTIAANLGTAEGVTVDQNNDVLVVGFNFTTEHGYVSEYASNGTLLSGTFMDLGENEDGAEYITITPVPEGDVRLLAAVGAGAAAVFARKKRRGRPG